jgi:hypothetical protein
VSDPVDALQHVTAAQMLVQHPSGQGFRATAAAFGIHSEAATRPEVQHQ